jgi:hypothetical protein
MKGWVDQGAQIDAPTWDRPGRPDTGEKFLWGCESCYAWLRRPIFRGRTRHAVDLESLSFSLYKCTRFDIIDVLYTCTTVASRVAANACATRLRFLTKPQTSSCLASSSLLGQRRALSRRSP